MDTKTHLTNQPFNQPTKSPKIDLEAALTWSNHPVSNTQKNLGFQWSTRFKRGIRDIAK